MTQFLALSIYPKLEEYGLNLFLDEIEKAIANVHSNVGKHAGKLHM